MIPWSTPDLTNITYVLKALVDNALTTSTLATGNIKTSCDAPDTRKPSDTQCLLTIYLLHVGRDPNWRNTPVQGSRGQLNNAQPLSLNLSYLLTAWCEKDFASEQLAMSIALQTFHSYPIVTKDLIDNQLLVGWPNDGEFVISIQADTIEEMSRLWQAFTVPMRLSALVKVSVVFISPLTTPTTSSIPPQTLNVALSVLAPESPPAPPPTPQLIGGVGVGIAPPTPNATLADLAPSCGPLVIVADGVAASPGQPPAGGTVAIAGTGLDLPNATDVYLSAPGGTPWNVTPWRLNKAADWLYLALPQGYADPATTPPPAGAPPPGLYNVAVGSPTPGGFRSNAIPLAIAPRVDGVTNPPALAKNAAGVYPIAGGGFIADPATTLSLGSTALAYSATGPGPGQFTIDPTGTQIAFLPPAAIASGAYPVLLAVNGVAATAGWVVSL